MVIMNVLRMLADVSFFFTFAGFIAVKCGGTGALAGALLQCLCFGLSYLGGNRRWLRLLCLLPMGLGWYFARGSLADCIVLAITAVYVIWLVFRKDYVLDQERQQTLFGVYWKILIGFVLITSLLGAGSVMVRASMPYAIIMLIASILLMRSLRHEPRVYCQRKYQLVNLGAVAAVGGAAWLISRPAVLNACAAAIKAVYNGIIRPILQLLLTALLAVIWGIGQLAALLFRGGEKELPQKEQVELDLSGMEGILPEDMELKEPSQLLRALGIVVLAAVVIVLLILFFRWLSKRRGQETEAVRTGDERETLPLNRRAAKKKESSPVRSIRAQYRRFLKYCAALGVEQKKSSTSRDIHNRVEILSGPVEISNRIRELYIRARYAGQADAEGVKQMKQLCSQAEKSGEKT